MGTGSWRGNVARTRAAVPVAICLGEIWEIVTVLNLCDIMCFDNKKKLGITFFKIVETFSYDLPNVKWLV